MAMKKAAPKKGASDKSKKADSARQSLLASSYASEYYLEPTLAQKAKGSDRGAQMKSDAARRKVTAANARRSAGYNRTPAQKKASSGKTTDLAGSAGYGNALLPSGKSGFVGNYSGLMGRTSQRGADQGKRAAAKPTKAQSARLTAQAKAAKKKK